MWKVELHVYGPPISLSNCFRPKLVSKVHGKLREYKGAVARRQLFRKVFPYLFLFSLENHYAAIPSIIWSLEKFLLQHCRGGKKGSRCLRKVRVFQ